MIVLGEVLGSAPDNYPNLKIIKTVFEIVQPHNMEVERGFSQTADILTDKRNLLSHQVYRNIKVTKRLFKCGLLRKH